MQASVLGPASVDGVCGGSHARGNCMIALRLTCVKSSCRRRPKKASATDWQMGKRSRINEKLGYAWGAPSSCIHLRACKKTRLSLQTSSETATLYFAGFFRVTILILINRLFSESMQDYNQRNIRRYFLYWFVSVSRSCSVSKFTRRSCFFYHLRGEWVIGLSFVKNWDSTSIPLCFMSYISYS